MANGYQTVEDHQLTPMPEESEMFLSGRSWKAFIEKCPKDHQRVAAERVPILNIVLKSLPEWFPFKPHIVPDGVGYVIDISQAQSDLLTVFMQGGSQEAVAYLTFVQLMFGKFEPKLGNNPPIPKTDSDIEEWTRGYNNGQD